MKLGMSREIQCLVFLSPLFFSLSCHPGYPNAKKMKSAPNSLAPTASPIVIKVHAKSQVSPSPKDKLDRDHCFGQDTADNPRDLFFEVTTPGVSKGTVMVELTNLSKVASAMSKRKPGDQEPLETEIQNYAEAMQGVLNKTSMQGLQSGTVTITFKADPKHLEKPGTPPIHLGPGSCDPECSAQYTANVSIVDTSTKRLSNQKVTQFTYYYATYDKDPSECTAPATPSPTLKQNPVK